VKNPKPSSLDSQDQLSLSEQETALVIDQPLESINADATPVDAQLELTDDDMPPIESLNADSDYSGFMSPKVSETLRRQALNKLFHLPHYNITDGLNDYDEDYTSFTKLGNVITHEMRRMMEIEEKLSQQNVDEEQKKQDATLQGENQTANNEQIVMSEPIASDEETKVETKFDNELTDNTPTDA